MGDSEGTRARSSGDALLAQLVQASPLPIAVVDIDTLDFVALSGAGAAFLGRGREKALPNVVDLVGEPDAAQEAFALIRTGVIDGYEARRQVLRPHDQPNTASLAVRDLGKFGFPRRALVLVTAPGTAGGSTELPRLNPAEPDVCAGSADRGGRIDRVSPEIGSLLGLRDALNAATFGARVHPDDLARLSDALALTSSARVPVSLTVRFQNRDGQWADVRLVVAADDDAGEPRVGFALTREHPPDPPATGSRVDQLEATLRRISNELQALGVAPRMATLPTAEELPELADLSARQWEIVSRLLAGERVPSIARSMFLSQSTIRNHLSAVFRKLGVHSQQELIEKLRMRSGGSSTGS